MVEFLSRRNKRQLSIVPNEWLLSEDKCVWPPYKSQSKIDEAVRCHQSPEDNWAVFDIRILASAGTSIFLLLPPIVRVGWVCSHVFNTDIFIVTINHCNDCTESVVICIAYVYEILIA